MRLLVVGANGLLGSNVVAAGRERDWTVAGTYHTDPVALETDQTRLDVRDDDRVREVIGARDPDLVVNCAAVTDVDGCEDHPDEARAVNAEAPGVLAAAADRQGAALVHVSTDYVFDGSADRPYPETATPRPLQAYGETKLAGERAVGAAHDAPLVARLSFVYGIHRGTGELTGFPAWAAGRLAEGRETPLFTDQRVTPTRAGFAAERLLDLAAAGVGGLVHVASRDCVTPYEMGRLVAAERGYDESLLARGRLADLDRPAERPRYSCLDTARLAALSGEPVPALEPELSAVL